MCGVPDHIVDIRPKLREKIVNAADSFQWIGRTLINFMPEDTQINLTGQGQRSREHNSMSTRRHFEDK